MNQHPIVIVGAGPTGALLACELARRGTEVRLIEKAPAPATESRAGGVHSRTLELFQRLGIVDELLAAGNPIRALSFRSGTRRIGGVDFACLDGPYPFMLHLPQYETQRVLDRYLERLGVQVERGVELLQLSQDQDGVSLRTRQGSGEGAISASYVVGCDGAHSTVRHQLGMPFEGQGYENDWLGADVDVDWEYPDWEAQVFAGPRGVLACFPFGRGHWRVFAPMVADRSEEHAPPSLEEMRALVGERGPAHMHIDNPTWLGVFRASRRSAPHYRQGRVFLAGDAVHIHSPAAGQGMNTGLGDAANLGWKLALVADGRAPESLLDTYEPERAPVARQVIEATHRLVKIFGQTSPLKLRLRDCLLPRLMSNPLAQRKIAGRLSQHSVSYRGGPLAIPCRSEGPVHSGDRAPDVTGLQRNGEVTSLFALIRRPGHTVFVACDANAGADGLPALLQRLAAYEDALSVFSVDPADPLARRYGLKAGWACAIRPEIGRASCRERV